MVENILQQVIETKSWDAVTICENSNKKLFNQYNAILKKLKNHVPPDMVSELDLLEDLFVQNHTEIVILAYKTGINDYKEMVKSINNFL